MADQQDELCALLNHSGEPTLERAIAKAREMVDRLDHVTLNIAVTGESGSGKSSFVNAIRGLQDTDEGAAPTGPTETTMEPTMYPHPTMPNVKIWDLPGIGGIEVQTYIKDVNYKIYDFFIIVSASRFKDNDITLAKEIRKNAKNFYFVRTKIDEDVKNEERKRFTEKATLQKIRNNCVKNLKTLGPPPVFLVTSHYLERFDFQVLADNLKRDLPDHKRDALVMSLPVYSKQSLEQKYNTFKKAAWAVAIASGAIGAIPVPGLSLAYDVFILMSFLTKCYYSFGLDDRSLKKLSERVNKPMQPMVKKSALVMEIAEKSFSSKMAARLGVEGVIQANGRLLPVAGNIAAARVSFENTQSVLLDSLKELYDGANIVLEMAGLK